MVAALTEKARRHIIDFCCFTLPKYRRAKHLDYIAEKLEAVERGEIKKLMIFVPPRHGKSELATIRFPAWYLGKNPENSIIISSYASNLARKFSKKARNTVETTKYNFVFPGITTSNDSRAVNDWSLSGHEGGLLSAGVDGPVTGHGANLFIIDDPVKNRKEAESDVYRERAWDWYRDVVLTRLEPDAAQILIMTRWHQDDLAGRILKEEADSDDDYEKWEIVDLPAIFEEALLENKEIKTDPIDRKEGEALWPAKYTIEVLDERKRKVGTRAWWALYQQRPTDPASQMFKREWFAGYDELPLDCVRGAGIDTATSKKTSADNMSLVDVCRCPNNYLYVDDVFLDKVTVAAFSRYVINQQRSKSYIKILIEENAAGEAVRQRIVEEGLNSTPPCYPPIIGFKTSTDKVVRAMEFQPLVENGTIRFKNGNPRVAALIDHLCDFDGQGGSVDDDVDGLGFGIKAVIAGYIDPDDIKTAGDDRKVTEKSYDREVDLVASKGNDRATVNQDWD